MTSTAARATRQPDRAAAAEMAAPPLASAGAAAAPVANVVAASAGSQTTSREPFGRPAVMAGGGHAGSNGVPAAARPVPTAGPGARFAAVNRASRITELVKWIATRRNFTFAEAAAASAPSPCSPAVMAYTLPDARLASGLAELGYRMTAGGKNGYTVTAITAAARLKATARP